MIIQHKDWYARINKMPGLAGPTLLVSGTVTVPNSNTLPTLVVAAVQDKSQGLRLDLQFESKGTGLTVMTEKAVAFSQASTYDVPEIAIFHDGKELIRINDVEIIN
ncbi:hypothetical protein [Pseudomonas sp. Irchel 3A5]|uniref:hypothetical protein n=1 Tax=Pseudomonas sp. Irchel 3A5 TaxID=2008911 RepID=UPI000BA34B3F|nr:hypothetical protein [Pseudomonas sp. Irchel 3A5]